MGYDLSEKQPEREFQKGQDCLRAAQKNFEIAELETAINRAYYAVFHAARSCLWLGECYPKTHAGVHRKFSQLYVKGDNIFSKEIYSILDELEDERILVDYAIPEEYDQTVVKTIVKRAEKFISEVNTQLGKKLNSQT